LLSGHGECRELNRAVEALEPLYPEWSLNGMGAVADIVHEGAPVPADTVTLENNPYRSHAISIEF